MSATNHDEIVNKVARVIFGFNWHNYGLDDIGEIRWRDADYARALAERIVKVLDRRGAP